VLQLALGEAQLSPEAAAAGLAHLQQHAAEGQAARPKISVERAAGVAAAVSAAAGMLLGMFVMIAWEWGRGGRGG
jgi:hypothetical protein